MRRPVKLPLWKQLLGTRCFLCGHRERKQEKLQLHHLDGNPKNTALWNLDHAHKLCHINISKINHQFSNSRRQEGSSARSEQEERERENGKETEVTPSSNAQTSFDPTQESEVRKRSKKIKVGLLNYLSQVAYHKAQTQDVILAEAPSWIDFNDPPSPQTLRRWLRVYTSGDYAFRFDSHDRLYLRQDISQVPMN